MAKVKIIFCLFLLSLSLLPGCGLHLDLRENEYDQAQQEIDTFNYKKAIARLELFEDRETLSDRRYIDLLSSAYLGAAGLDLLRILAHWANHFSELRRTQLAKYIQGRGTPNAFALLEFKEIIYQLTPDELDSTESFYFKKALQLCNEKIGKDIENSSLASKHILLKTVFVNLWGSLKILKTEVIPGLEKLFSQSHPKEVFCEIFDRTTKKIADVSVLSSRILLSVSTLGEQRGMNTSSLLRISYLASSLEWMKNYPSCTQVSDVEINKIKKALNLN